MEFTFAPRDGGTLMTLNHAGFPTEELRVEHGTGFPTPSTASRARSNEKETHVHLRPLHVDVPRRVHHRPR